MSANRNKVIVGRNGNLANQLKTRYPDARVISRDEYLSWDNVSDIHKILDSQSTDIFLAIGITSSKASTQDLELMNYRIPSLIAKAISIGNSRIITFGTIMEKKPELSKNNPYVASKRRLNLFLQNNLRPESYLHLLIHTLYGGKKVNPHMFLGQILSAIGTKSAFHMSSGRQVREYHHIDDDLRATELLLDNKLNGIQEISHCESFSLEKIAKTIFSHFNLRDKLFIGETSSNKEIFKPIGIRHPLLKEFNFQPSLPGIITFIEEQLHLKNPNI